ncbi:hypothetical protein MTR67_044516 [Solanum verrucosum]|uniref:Uncharacterized protein n=1 Tax=Solanum verrucosum TaxID=315347 RepID=A0AAF0UU35_SOLVR|nr:hypothetical protein MTR67_044516 [Solanum verrucosum]
MSILPLKSLGFKKIHSYEQAPVEILDRQVRKLKNKEISFVKVLWRNQLVKGAIWEARVYMISKYPHFFPYSPILTWGISYSWFVLWDSCILVILLVPYAYL